MPEGYLPRLNQSEFTAALLRWKEYQLAQGFSEEVVDGWVANIAKVAMTGIGPHIPHYKDILEIGAPERVGFERQIEKQKQTEREVEADKQRWAQRQELQKGGTMRGWQTQLDLQKAQQERQREWEGAQLDVKDLNVQQWQQLSEYQKRLQSGQSGYPQWQGPSQEHWDIMAKGQVAREKTRYQAEGQVSQDINRAAWDKWKEARLGELDPDYDWIERYKLGRMKNPYMPKVSTGWGVGGAGAGATVGSGTAETGFTWSPMSTAQVSRFYGVDPAMYPTERPSEFPPSPAWLSRLTGTTAGTPINKVPAMTPTAPWMRKRTEGEKKQLAGYLKYVGGESYEDVMGRMESMLPKTPSFSRRWKPTRQRV